MNAQDVLKIGHQQVLTTIENISSCEQASVRGEWSAKDIIAHLASYELLLSEALLSLTEADKPTPLIDAWAADCDAFNTEQVAQRRGMTLQSVCDEYITAYEQATERLAALPAKMYRQKGVFPWYGEPYALEDLLVYQYYGHKCAHLAQIETFHTLTIAGG